MRKAAKKSPSLSAFPALHDHYTNRSVSDPLDFIECDGIAASVIETCCPCAFVAGHGLRDLELAAILEVGGDPRCTKAMGADFRAQPGRLAAALNHCMHVGLRKRLAYF